MFFGHTYIGVPVFIFEFHNYHNYYLLYKLRSFVRLVFEIQYYSTKQVLLKTVMTEILKYNDILS